MLESNAMVSVSLHYWAGAKAAAGVAEEQVEAQSVAEALRLACLARSDPRFDAVIKASSVLIDGRAAHQQDLERQLTGSVQVEVLPPFAGGT
jgi:sulfur-carrier protein